MKKVVEFIKKETVLSIAWLVAIASAFWVHPSKEYFSYIDWRSLGILWSLMAIVQGLKSNYVFDKMGWVLLGRTRKVWQLNSVLILLCFVSSMFITNDVALITFVPFAVMMLKKCKHEELMIPVIVLQTVAANLGSMLTPIGNPQNLYLYGLSGLSLGEFVACMLPYTLLAGILLTGSLALLKGKNEKIVIMDLIMQEKGDAIRNPVQNNMTKEEHVINEKRGRKRILIYFLLFLLALLTVVHVVPFVMLVVSVLILIGILEFDVLLKVDYTLLLTFIGFFIFTGNVGKIAPIKEILQTLVLGHETVVGIGASQVISNVPAALLLSGFTSNYKALLVGVNLGGLGTLIASMASLISYKIFVNEYNESKGKYFVTFTLVNILYLALLGVEAFVIQKII